MRVRLLLAWLVVLAPIVLAEGLPDLGEASSTDLSPQVERHIGESIMRDIRLRDPAYVDDAELNEYINQLGNRLAAASPEPRHDLEFFIVRDPTLNAFAIPGGFIGVHSGLVLATQSESELAGVLAHEISHVTQRHLARMTSKQGQAQITQLLAVAVAILAARSNSQVSEAALSASMAVDVQSRLNYSRDFEREADRLGIQTLDRAGFDVRGMGAFFERLQKFSRLYESTAPGYLHTHPLATERIADMENRIQLAQYRQVTDSLEFQLVRAKLKVSQGATGEAVAEFEGQLRERKYLGEAAAYYGLALAHLRARNLPEAERQLGELHRLKAVSPMVESLAAEVKQIQGDAVGAARLYREARGRYPESQALAYSEIEALLAAERPREALATTSAELQLHPENASLYSLQARSYAALGKRTLQHRAQAEVYVLRRQLPAAIEQLILAQQAGDGDFYEQSQVDARLRELRARLADEAR